MFKKLKRENWPWYLVVSVIIGLWCLITTLLFLNTIISSFKENIDIFTRPWLLPQKIVFDNYQKLIKDGFMRYFANSFGLLIASIVCILALAAPASYGLGKFKFKGNKLLRNYFLVGMMFPVQLGVIPLFNLLKTLNLVDNLFGIFLIYIAGISIPVFILTNFTQNVPEELREAARIDGANEVGIFTRIFLPLMRPAIAAMIPLLAVGIWNDFFVPLVFISSDAFKTVPLGLMRYFTSKGFKLEYIGVIFAAMSLSIFPLIALYLVGSKNIIEGLTQGSIK